MAKGKAMVTYRAGSSLFYKMDPRIKIASLGCAIAVIVMAHNLWSYILAVLVTVGMCVGAKIRPKDSLGPVFYLFPFFIIIFLMNFFFYGKGRPWGKWWIFAPSLPGLLQGINVVVKVILVMAASACLLISTPPVEMTYALQSLISPLRFLGVPVGQIALIISVAIEFIPSLFEEFNLIKEAQTARGAQFESTNIFKRAKAYLPLFLPIFMTAFRRADELSLAMEARGYRTSKRKSAKRFASPCLRDWLILLVSALLVVAQAFLLKAGI
ncbi:MAG: energy-coupling factor transporter transmembrane protein EcfT [Aeriscardovia sp.]|nr:energy-coupling factor transporter transmembrane protein EcfT [Aeriscardovia sp.]